MNTKLMEKTTHRTTLEMKKTITTPLAMRFMDHKDRQGEETLTKDSSEDADDQNTMTTLLQADGDSNMG
jgi:hypothetical protein